MLAGIASGIEAALARPWSSRQLHFLTYPVNHHRDGEAGDKH
jgi:hypothetical protein